jgi:hypothetical protein
MVQSRALASSKRDSTGKGARLKKNAESKNIVNGPGTAGYFEEIIIEATGLDWPKCVGVRLVENNDEGRLLGVAGKRELELTAPIEVMRCFKKIIIKASPKRPVRVVTYLQKLEGRR